MWVGSDIYPYDKHDKAFYSRFPINHCWKKQSFLNSYENFKFLNEKKLYSESEEELADNIEMIVKSEGFLPDKEFQVFSNISLECIGNNQWVVSEGDLAM